MILFNKLIPFYFYRTNKTYYVSSNQKNNKVGLMISTFAPSVKDSFKYISDMSSHIIFKGVERYFVDNKVIYTKYPSNKVIKTIQEEYIREAMKGNEGTNVTNMSNIIIFNITLDKCPPLKNFNFFYESGIVLDDVMHNEKDKRTPITKGADLLGHFITEVADKTNRTIFENHHDRYLFIPVNEWIPFEDYRNENTFKRTYDNYLISLFTLLDNNGGEKLKLLKGWKFVLTNLNEIYILDIDKIIDDMAMAAKDSKHKAQHTSMLNYLRSFMKKCKSTKQALSNDIMEDGINNNLTEVEIESAARIKAEEIIDKSIINKDDVTEEDIDNLTDMIKAKMDNGEAFEMDPSQEQDVVELTRKIKATLSNTSIESIKRNEMLAEKYATPVMIRADGTRLEPVQDTVIPITPLNVRSHLTDDTLKNITTANFFQDYIKNYFYSDLLLILKHFSTCNPRMFMINELKEEDVSDNLNKVLKYSVTFESEDRSRHNMKFLLPKFYQDNHLFLNGSKKDITSQKMPYPVTKTAPNMTQLVGNYKKVFIERYGQNISPKVTRIIKYLNEGSPKDVTMIKGDASSANLNYLIPLEFEELSKYFYIIKSGKNKIVFKIADMILECPPYKGDKTYARYLPFAKINGAAVYLDSHTEMVVSESGSVSNSVSDFIIDFIIGVNKDNTQKFEETKIGSKYMYSRAIIMSYNVPIVILASAIADGGLQEVLKRANIEYELSDKRPSVDKNSQGVIKFEDTYLIYNRTPFSNALLLEGFYELETSDFTFSSMNERETYADIFDIMYNKRNLIEAFENFKQLFVDPIHLIILNRLGLPTDFLGLLLMGSDLLADNKFRQEASYDQARLRGPEIILAYLYQALGDSYGRHRINPKINKFTIPEDAVIKLLMSSQLVDEHPTSNTVLEDENRRRIKSKGPTGLNVDQSYTLDKRAFHKTMKGITGLSTAVSGEVGITRTMTVNANLADARGFVKTNVTDDEMNGTNMLGPAELMNTFSVESADASRTMMATGQNKHLISTVDMVEPLISHDFERVLPYLSYDFAFTSKEAGKVLSIENDVMILQYKSGKIVDVDLNNTASKHTNTGKYNINYMLPLVKEGDSFEGTQILAYNPKHYRKDIFGDIVAMNGTLGLAAFVSNGSSFEDSTYILESATKGLETFATIKKDIVISYFSNVKKYAKKDDNVEVNDYLLVFDDAQDEFVSSIISSADESMEDIHFGSKPVKSKVKGVIRDIKVYFTVPFEELTPSMQAFIKYVTSFENKKEKTIKKHMDLKDANTIISPMTQSQVDSLGRVKGMKAEDSVIIEYYVEYSDILGVGDKVTFNSAVKGTINSVIPDKYAAFIEDDPDSKIEIFASTIGVVKRMVLDIIKIGIGNAILINHKKELISKFGEEITREAAKYKK